MITSKRITVIVAVVTCLALECTAIMMYMSQFTAAAALEYEKRLFNGETVIIEIEATEEDWRDFLQNGQSKEYFSADLTINGDLFAAVGIRAKGNTSLTQVDGEKNRYSMQLDPDQYISGQSFYGLDNMCLNNLMADATYMKDYLSYDIMEYLGVPAPLRNYAQVWVNGELYGLYLLLERYDNSFLDKTYGSSTGELYNVKMQAGGQMKENGASGEGGQSQSRGKPGEGAAATGEMPNDFDGQMPFDERGSPPDQSAEAATEPLEGQGEATQGEDEAELFSGGDFTGGFERPDMSGGGGSSPGGMNSSGGGSLVYNGNDAQDYSAIFDNAVSSKVSDNDKKQVITAIQKLGEGENLEQYWDTDEILRYLAAHTFVVNLDSYVSNMQQNYYLLERESVISILPWDYNLAFGGFQSGDASAIINFPIDTPVSGVEIEDRPLVSQLLSSEKNLEKYHEYLSELVTGYIDSGLLEDEIDRLNEQIGKLVKTDPTAFYSYEDYEAALPMLKNLITLRAQSVAGQLAGEIPSTTQGQSEQAHSLIDASSVNLSLLGTMGGGGGGDRGGDRQSQTDENAPFGAESSQTDAQDDSQSEGSDAQGETGLLPLSSGDGGARPDGMGTMVSKSPPGQSSGQAFGAQGEFAGAEVSYWQLALSAASMFGLFVAIIFLAKFQRRQ